MNTIRNTLTVITLTTAAAIATGAHAAQDNGRDSVYHTANSLATKNAVQLVDQVPGRAGGVALSAKLKATGAGSNVADVVNRLGRA